jgi:hypothetical protein
MRSMKKRAATSFARIRPVPSTGRAMNAAQF